MSSLGETRSTIARSSVARPGMCDSTYWVKQDRAVVRGDAQSGVILRIVGGGRADVLIDETTGFGEGSLPR